MKALENWGLINHFNKGWEVIEKRLDKGEGGEAGAVRGGKVWKGNQEMHGK